MPDTDRRLLLAGCESVEMRFGSILCKQHGRVRHVYFPTGGSISLLTQLGGRTGLEVGLVGAEGAVRMTLALGTDIAPVRTVVQGSGSALRIDATRFSAALVQVLPRTIFGPGATPLTRARPHARRGVIHSQRRTIRLNIYSVAGQAEEQKKSS